MLLILCYESSTFGVIMSWSGRVGSVCFLWSAGRFGSEISGWVASGHRKWTRGHRRWPILGSAMAMADGIILLSELCSDFS